MTAYDDWIDEQNQIAQERYEAELREQFMPELYEDFARAVLSGKDKLYGEVIAQFTSERLQSFYQAHPDVAERAVKVLSEARSLADKKHPAAALVFAVTAIEVGLRTTLLYPILHGLVSLDATGPLVATLVPSQHNDTFKKVLFGVLRDVGKLDLLAFKRAGSNQTLWEEIETARKLRQDVVHEAARVEDAAAMKAIEIAATVVEILFPRVAAALGLKTDANLRIVV